MLAMIAERRIRGSYAPAGGAATSRSILAALREGGVATQGGGPTLEMQREAEAPPRVEAATSIEGNTLAVRPVQGEPVVAIAGFLDGIQRSTVRAHHHGVPIVHGAVGAAVRERHDRKLATWQEPLRSHALYLPVSLVDAGLVQALREQVAVVDTLDGHEPSAPMPRHPGDLAARALTAVQRERERCEQALALAWTETASEPLLIDGGIAGAEAVAKSPLVVGVVKSHRTLYAVGESIDLILGLREAERTTAMALSSPRRTPVATWYLRLRDAGARGPFFGLVRVEVALESAADITARADVVSRWLLAERAPVALPDARWDVMVYGIRECEQYLTAILQ